MADGEWKDGAIRTISHVSGGSLEWRAGSGNTVEIFDIAVPNEARRQGRGRWMVDRLIKMAEGSGVRTVFAITRASNGIAQNFYNELRFRSIILWNFYKDEPLKDGRDYSDAVMYVRDIGSQA